MRVLGVSAFYHDSAAALVDDGRIVAAAQEERFTRRKFDAAYPRLAINYCLNEAGIELKDLDYVVFFEMTEGRSVIAGSPGQGVDFPKSYAEEAATFLTSLIPAG